MDQELIPSLDPLISDILNDSPISLPMPPQFSPDMLDWFNLFGGSDISCDHNEASSASHASVKAKNIASDQGDKSTSGENKAKVVRKRKAIPQRIAFHTKSDDDVLDDGYRWRKYGQKTVKNNPHPRSYYRCSHHTCRVKKQIQRLSRDFRIVVTTYEGVHNHPCEKLMETLGPLLKQLQFLSRI